MLTAEPEQTRVFGEAEASGDVAAYVRLAGVKFPADPANPRLYYNYPAGGVGADRLGLSSTLRPVGRPRKPASEGRGNGSSPLF